MAQSDLNELLNHPIDTAEMLLTKGAFLPVGAIMLSKILTETFQKEAEEVRLRAAGMAYDVLTVPTGKQQKQDAICFSLEHCLGEAVDVFRPYIRTEDGKFQFEEIFAAARTQQFFRQLPRG